MALRDQFVCEYCDYEWRTKKDVGEPAICPRCKKEKIINRSLNTRRLEEKLEKERRSLENSEKELKEIAERELKKFYKSHQSIHRWVQTRWIFVTLGAIIIFLGKPLLGTICIILGFGGIVTLENVKEKLGLKKRVIPSIEKVAKVGIIKGKGKYFINEGGEIIKEYNGLTERIAKVGIKKQEGYVYFVDNEGDISRREYL